MRETATAGELEAALLEVAESSIAMYRAGDAARRISDAYMTAMTRGTAATEQRSALETAYQQHADAQRRHRSATAHYLTIRPEGTS